MMTNVIFVGGIIQEPNHMMARVLGGNRILSRNQIPPNEFHLLGVESLCFYVELPFSDDGKPGAKSDDYL